MASRAMVGYRQTCIGVVLLLVGSVGWPQTQPELQKRIPKPDVRKYERVTQAKDWRNPYLIVRAEGVEIVGVTHGGQVSVDAIPKLLENLPASSWPYGLVVAVQEQGISSEAKSRFMTQQREKLLKKLKELGIVVELWPSG